MSPTSNDIIIKSWISSKVCGRIESVNAIGYPKINDQFKLKKNKLPFLNIYYFSLFLYNTLISELRDRTPKLTKW